MTKMYRSNRDHSVGQILANLEFCDITTINRPPNRYPKISTDGELRVLNKLLDIRTKIRDLQTADGQPIYYRSSGGRYFKVVTNYPTGSSKEVFIKIRPDLANIIGAIMSTSLFFWWYQIMSNNLDLKKRDVLDFPAPIQIRDYQNKNICCSYKRYLTDAEEKAINHHKTSYSNIDSYKEYKLSRSIHLIDDIDDLVGPIYNLHQKDVDWIKNYDREFRIAL